MLAGAVAPGGGQAVPVAEDKLPGVAGRQRHAAGGKELPVSVDGETLTEVTAEAGSESDEDEGATDTPFAWFAVAPVAPESAPIVVKLPVAGAPSLAVEGDSAAPVPELEVPGGTLQPEGTGAAEITAQAAQLPDVPTPVVEADALVPAVEAPAIEVPAAPKAAPAARATIELPADFQPVR
ncbi:hypothetical protein P1X14_18815, partial [Sphingomonas sp. AOB5]|nr:hypothetical protein [Sphingomonas sp. AOB5]